MASVEGGGGSSGSSLGAGMSIAGTAVKIFGDLYGGKAQSNMYQYQAQVARQLAAAEAQAANVTEYAGGRAAEAAGLRYGGQIARGTVGYGAGNVGGRTVQDVKGSQIALGRQAQAETYAKYAETAYGERLRGAEETAKAGEMDVAAKVARTGSYINVAGDIVGGAGQAYNIYTGGQSVVGSSQPVASKWYGG